MQLQDGLFFNGIIQIVAQNPLTGDCELLFNDHNVITRVGRTEVNRALAGVQTLPSVTHMVLGQGGSNTGVAADTDKVVNTPTYTKPVYTYVSPLVDGVSLYTRFSITLEEHEYNNYGWFDELGLKLSNEIFFARRVVTKQDGVTLDKITKIPGLILNLFWTIGC